MGTWGKFSLSDKPYWWGYDPFPSELKKYILGNLVIYIPIYQTNFCIPDTSGIILT